MEWNSFQCMVVLNSDADLILRDKICTRWQFHFYSDSTNSTSHILVSASYGFWLPNNMTPYHDTLAHYDIFIIHNQRLKQDFGNWWIPETKVDLYQFQPYKNWIIQLIHGEMCTIEIYMPFITYALWVTKVCYCGS